jgi:hypothetical protein
LANATIALKVSASFALAGIEKMSRHEKAKAINFISILRLGFFSNLMAILDWRMGTKASRRAYPDEGRIVTLRQLDCAAGSAVHASGGVSRSFLSNIGLSH